MSGSPSASSVEEDASGSALTRSPISRSAGRIGVPTTSRTTRMPVFQTVCSSELVARAAGRGRAAATIGGQAEQAERAEQRVADQRAPADAGLLDALRRGRPTVARRGPRRRSAAGWRISTISWSPISLRAHWMSADADAAAGRGPRVSAERDVGGAEAGDGVRVVADRRRRSRRRRTATSADRRTSAEQRRDLALGALLGLRVDVGRAPLVRGADPGWRSGSSRRRARSSPGSVVRSVVARSRVRPSSWSVRVVWAAIQTAKPTQRADADEPGEQALGHRAEAAEAEAAVVGLVLAATSR